MTKSTHDKAYPMTKSTPSPASSLEWERFNGADGWASRAHPMFWIARPPSSPFSAQHPFDETTWILSWGHEASQEIARDPDPELLKATAQRLYRALLGQDSAVPSKKWFDDVIATVPLIVEREDGYYTSAMLQTTIMNRLRDTILEAINSAPAE